MKKIIPEIKIFKTEKSAMSSKFYNDKMRVMIIKFHNPKKAEREWELELRAANDIGYVMRNNDFQYLRTNWRFV